MALTREQFLLSRRRIHQVLDYIDLNLNDEALSLDRLADVACLSRFHFLRLYVDRVGESPVATVRRLRLQSVRDGLLAGAQESITHLAAKSGYGSVAAFSRAFTRAFAVSPTQLRDGVLGVGGPVRGPAAYRVARLPAIPVLRQPFTGRAAEVYGFGHEIEWAATQSNVHYEKHWAVHPDGWVDPERFPDRWVRMCHCFTSATGLMPSRVPFVDQAYLGAGDYVCFEFVGNQAKDIAASVARFEMETDWRVGDGPLLRISSAPFSTPVAERQTSFYLPIWR